MLQYLISQRSLEGAIKAGSRQKTTALISGSSLPPISLFKGANLLNPARKRRVFYTRRFRAKLSGPGESAGFFTPGAFALAMISHLRNRSARSRHRIDPVPP